MAADGNPTPRPPSNADFNEIFNRIALARAKHHRVVSLAGHRPLTPPVTPPSAPPNTTSTTAAAGGGFSSFSASTATSSSQSQTPASSNSPRTAASAAANDPRLADDFDDRHPWAPDNAGIGYTPPSSSKSSTAQQDRETALLRKKVLGRNAARQLAEREQQHQRGVGRKRGVAAVSDDGSESEEELGKGALVKGRKKPVVAALGGKAGGSGGQGDDGASRRKKARVEGLAGIGSGASGGSEAEAAEKEKGEGGDVDSQEGAQAAKKGGDVAMTDTGAEEERNGAGTNAPELKGTEKKKKKKKKSNKRKQNKGLEGIAEGEAEGVEN
ncbi:hypothetical protein P885DRAFT_61541 [Corynascus similis CBS 632.67]